MISLPRSTLQCKVREISFVGCGRARISSHCGVCCGRHVLRDLATRAGLPTRKELCEVRRVGFYATPAVRHGTCNGMYKSWQEIPEIDEHFSNSSLTFMGASHHHAIQHLTPILFCHVQTVGGLTSPDVCMRWSEG